VTVVDIGRCPRRCGSGAGEAALAHRPSHKGFTHHRNHHQNACSRHILGNLNIIHANHICWIGPSSCSTLGPEAYYCAARLRDISTPALNWHAGGRVVRQRPRPWKTTNLTLVRKSVNHYLGDTHRTNQSNLMVVSLVTWNNCNYSKN
jgi:hypothetical protein